MFHCTANVTFVRKCNQKFPINVGKSKTKNCIFLTINVNILEFFDADPGYEKDNFGSGMEKIPIRDPVKHPGSATLLKLSRFQYFRTKW
jgi:hypothetical protein